MIKLSPSKLDKVVDELTDMVLDWWNSKELLETTPYIKAQQEIRDYIKRLLENLDD